MELDKPLDDMITDKKRSNTRPRQSRERRDVPYAVRPPPGRAARLGLHELIHPQRPPPRSTEDKWVHDAYQGGGRGGRGPAASNGGRHAADVAGSGVGFTGVSPRIEVVGLHYEVTPQDLKASRATYLKASSGVSLTRC